MKKTSSIPKPPTVIEFLNPDSEKTNGLGVLKNLPCGNFVYDLMSEDGVKWEIGLFEKMEERKINNLGFSPIFEIRVGLIEMNGVPVVNLISRVNRDSNTIHEGFLNYGIENEMPVFKLFSTQETIPIVFVNENTDVIRVIHIQNKLKDSFKKFIDIASNRLPWSMSQFDEAKAAVMNNYELLELWNSHLQS